MRSLPERYMEAGVHWTGAGWDVVANPGLNPGVEHND
jgi:hypothetical protein